MNRSCFTILTTIALILLFAAQQYATYWQYLNYQFNPESYAKNCINKSRPALKCHGKCQLTKQQEQTREQESDQRNERREQVSASYFIGHQKSFPDDLFELPIAEIQHGSQPVLIHLYAGFIPGIFHPPLI